MKFLMMTQQMKSRDNFFVCDKTNMEKYTHTHPRLVKKHANKGRDGHL